MKLDLQTRRRLDQTEERVDSLRLWMDQAEKRVDSLNRSVSEQETRLSQLSEQLNEKVKRPEERGSVLQNTTNTHLMKLPNATKICHQQQHPRVKERQKEY